jgi:hypothetical protein
LFVASTSLTTSISRAQNVDTVTVEARRKSQKLEHDVNVFVSSAIYVPKGIYNESLERWTYLAVCPRVSGLNKEQGEFILSRLSAIARTAGVPLAGETCKPNFSVVVTAEPELFLRKMIQQPRAFDAQRGPPLERFIATPRPVRVWRDIVLTSIDGANHVRAHGEKSYDEEPPGNTLPSIFGSRLNVSTVTRDIVGAVIIVDAQKVHDLNFGQLADYIGLIGFAQIELDKDLGDAPTILNLFRAPADARPQGMTIWDKALLHALYSTSQRDAVQVSQMQTAALKEILSDNLETGKAKN